jgi:hypothetical protein
MVTMKFRKNRNEGKEREKGGWNEGRERKRMRRRMKSGEIQ